ncbi:MAG TPA: hypothetical protein VJ979_05785 [Actinomycetota bacterium]|nr:hypothetical protein [Actinomycetota bacterium]
MEHRALRAYLEDHLVGSEAGLRAARRLQRRSQGGLRDAADELVSHIPAEQQILREVMSAAGRRPQPVRIASHAAGAASSIAIWVRRNLPEPVPSALEDLEALIVGVRGKHLLWRTLAQVAAADDTFQRWPFDRLASDALDQERALVGFHDRSAASML